MSTELERVERGPDPGERPEGFLIAFDWRSEMPEQVIARAKEVVRSVSGMTESDFESGPAAAALPDWFVASCAPDRRTRARSAAEERWSVDNWVCWMGPEMRAWWWWDAQVVPGGGRVTVEVEGWPYATGALRWLLTASGARDVTDEGPA